MSTLKTVSEGRSDIHRINPSHIKINEGYNVRYNYGDIDELSRQIAAQGVRNPLVVEQKEGEIFLVEGHRRLKAIQSLLTQGIDVPTVPVIARRFSAIDRTLDLLLSNEGKQLDLLEQGEVFARLVGEGLKPKEISEQSGKTQGHISNCLALYAVPQEVKDFIIAGKIAASEVISLQREYEGDALVKKVAALVAKAESQGKKKVTKKTMTEGSGDEGGEEEPSGDFTPEAGGEKILRSSFNRVQEFLDSTNTVSEADKATILAVLKGIVE